MLPYLKHDLFARLELEFFHIILAPESAYDIRASDTKRCIAIAGKATHDAWEYFNQ
jgi:hypothetical protein